MSADFEAPANVAVATTIRALSDWQPGIVRVRGRELAFQPKGASEAVPLLLAEITQVRLSTHVIGADDVLLTTRNDGTWSIRVSNGANLIDALRERGVVAER